MRHIDSQFNWVTRRKLYNWWLGGKVVGWHDVFDGWDGALDELDAVATEAR